VTAGPFSSAVPRSSDVIAQESFSWLYAVQLPKAKNVLLQLRMPNYIPILQMRSDHDRIKLFHCLSNHMRVCVSVTLSVNSPTGQTPQRIFTVDSLKDTDLRKDVPFGGLDDE